METEEILMKRQHKQPHTKHTRINKQNVEKERETYSL